jgi:hypothetical protein
MAQRPGGGFDMARMSTGSKILLGAGLLYFISLFLPWADVFGDVAGEFGVGGEALVEATGVDTTVQGFQGALGILTALLALALITWEALLAFGVNVQMGTMSPGLISAIIAGALALFGSIHFFEYLSAIAWGAFLGLILLLAIAYGAYMRFTESKAGPAPM